MYRGWGLQELEYHMNCLPWHRMDISVYRRYLRSGDRAVDVGANLRFVTTIRADVVGKTGTVFSFGPAQATFTKLQLTIRANELTQVGPIGRAAAATRKRRPCIAYPLVAATTPSTGPAAQRRSI
jgi:hypothetical protein